MTPVEPCPWCRRYLCQCLSSHPLESIDIEPHGGKIKSHRNWWAFLPYGVAQSQCSYDKSMRIRQAHRTGVSMRQLARQMGVSTQTIKGYLERAKRYKKSPLEQYLENTDIYIQQELRYAFEVERIRGTRKDYGVGACDSMGNHGVDRETEPTREEPV